MTRKKKPAAGTDSSKTILDALQSDAPNQAHIHDLKAIFQQQEHLRPSTWKNQILALNAMKIGPGFALNAYMICKLSGDMPGGVDLAELAFWNFLLDNGACRNILASARHSLMMLIVHQKNIHALRWILEECHFEITECPGVNNPINHGLISHPIKHIDFRVPSAFNDYFISQLSARSPLHETPVILALRHGTPPLVAWLIHEKKCDINAANDHGVTPLIEAVKQSNWGALGYLIKCNACVSSKTKNGLTAIHYAIWNLNLHLVTSLTQALASQGKCIADIRDNEGLTVLHWAIKFNKEPLLEYLESLFQIDEAFLDPDGKNLAVFAVALNRPEIAGRLIEQYGLNIKATDSNGMSALFLNIVDAKNGIKSIEWLINIQNFNLQERNHLGDTPLVFAARVGNHDVTAYLLTKMTADLNAVNASGNHVGHYLAEQDQHEVIKSLLKHNKIDLLHVNAEGRTMLDIALIHEAKLTIETCIEYIQTCNKKNNGTPFMSLRKIQCLPALLKRFCNDHWASLGPWVEAGQPPLHIACFYLPQVDIEQLIIQFKLDVNQLNQHNNTALYEMVKLSLNKPGLIPKTRWFIEMFDPRLTKLDPLGSSLLHLACESQDLELTNYCVENRGLSLLKPRKDHLNAMDIALVKQNLTLVTYLWNRLTPIERASYIAHLNSKKECEHIAYLMTSHLYEPPFSEAQEDKLQLESPARKAAPTLDITLIPSEPIVCDGNGLFEAIDERRIDDIKSLNAFASEWIAYPKCCQNNPMLKSLLHQLSGLIKSSTCHHAYIYGSFHFKNPNDLDILLPNIATIEAKNSALALINLLISDTGTVTIKDRWTGEYGYRKHGLHIIPMDWRGIKIEWVLTEKTFQNHALMLDFTIGAQYFNLRTLHTHEIPGLNSRHDVCNKRINTISEARDSFGEDLSRFFRAIRLMADEGFHLSEACESALNDHFSDDFNPFIRMNQDKLNQQLTLLFKSPDPAKHVKILYELRALNKLFDCLSNNAGQAAGYYKEQLRPYIQHYYPPEVLQACLVPPVYLSGNPFVFYSQQTTSPESPFITALHQG